MVNFMVGAFYHIFKMEGKKKRQGSKHLHIHNHNVSMMGSENEGMGGVLSPILVYMGNQAKLTQKLVTCQCATQAGRTFSRSHASEEVGMPAGWVLTLPGSPYK